MTKPRAPKRSLKQANEGRFRLSPNKVFGCEACDRNFATRASLNRHNERVHKEKETVEAESTLAETARIEVMPNAHGRLSYS
ncbi:hypothetical protein [Absidia glauca]|uniref:C2H2-type domain-containing protein n=1 Tax=Absidia glauca TaxID=4829 RepID=A0A163MAR3_ABSGL|nr:hypothetical protein [Absidia glauca]